MNHFFNWIGSLYIHLKIINLIKNILSPYWKHYPHYKTAGTSETVNIQGMGAN